MTSDGNGGTFTYDLANNMVTASKINSGVYKYNALHQRVEKAVTVSGVTTKTYYIYNTNGSLLGEYDASGNVIAEHVYLKNIPVAVVKGANTYFVHTDYLNTPRAVSNSSGTVVWKWDNVNAYGYNPANETVSGTPFEYNQRFSGQYFDKETGLHYNYHRMYNPELGRYMQPDPIGVNGGMNIYSYVENNPLNAIDRLGLAEGYINYGLTKNETDGWFYFMFKVEEYYKEFNPFINDKLRLLSHGSYQTLNQFTPEELANQIISGNFKTNYGIKNNKYYDEQIKSGKPIRLRLEACNTGANWMNATMTGDVQEKAYMDVLGNLLRSDLKNRGVNNMLTIEAPNGLTSFTPLGDSVSPPTKPEWNGNIGKFIEKEY